MSQRKKRSQFHSPAERGNFTFLRVVIAFGSVVAIALLGFLVWGLATGGSTTGTPEVTPEVTGAPKLKVNQEKVDLGDIKLGKTVETAFELTNAGDQPLRITQEPVIEVVEGC